MGDLDFCLYLVQSLGGGFERGFKKHIHYSVQM